MNYKKILIISEESDYSTSQVIDWLLYYDIDFIRVNDSDLFDINEINIADKIQINATITLKSSKKKININSSDLKSIWYRRGFLNSRRDLYNNLNCDKEINKEIQLEYENQVKYIENFLNLLTRSNNAINSIGNELDNNTNKLYNLKLAQNSGLKVPNSLMTNNKKALKEFYNKYKHKIITKPISQGTAMGFNSKISGFTTLIDSELLKSIPDFFPQSFFQENIKKIFEVRTFFIKGKTFSMAIFSQQNEKTEVDFRNYSDEKPNRTPPYVLPEEINIKVSNFMSALNMESGSIDFLVDNLGVHYFLEVNPIGQYHQVSYPCNYNLDKIIAEELT